MHTHTVQILGGEADRVTSQSMSPQKHILDECSQTQEPVNEKIKRKQVVSHCYNFNRKKLITRFLT